MDRSEVAAPKKPLDSERWAGAIDNVGGEVLAGLLPQMAVHSSVASCGLAGGNALNTTVFPFILRGVNVLGIDSARMSNQRRREIWLRVRSDLRLDLLDQMITIEPLGRVFELGEAILAGKIRGRTVIDVNA
jgi:acrylyl-CoA reductase (NADPH)